MELWRPSIPAQSRTGTGLWNELGISSFVVAWSVVRVLYHSCAPPTQLHSRAFLFKETLPFYSAFSSLESPERVFYLIITASHLKSFSSKLRKLDAVELCRHVYFHQEPVCFSQKGPIAWKFKVGPMWNFNIKEKLLYSTQSAFSESH